jgi:hypothetical protein
MKPALSWVLSVYLITSPCPVAAQERTQPTTTSFAAAITHEVARLAAVGQSQLRDRDWSSVRNLTAGTELVVTTQGRSPRARYLVAADESELTVLNLSSPTLSTSARHALQDTLSTHPEVFGPGQQARPDVRVGPDGVFVAGRKVAETQELLERIARADVLEIGTPTRTRGSLRGAVTFAGIGLMFSLPVFLGSAECTPSNGNCHALLLRQSSILWLPLAGGLLGYYGLSQKAHERVIYAAP